MLINADITLYNRKHDKETRLDNWHRTVIKGVNFYVDNKVALTDAGLKSADVFKIRIPTDAYCEKSYVPASEYKTLEDVSEYWTLQNDDVLVCGIYVTDISRPSELNESGQRYCKITSWADNRFRGLPHWRIGGV